MTTNTTNASTLLSLAEDPSLIGRDIIIEEDNYMMRGPIATVEIIRGDSLAITLEWLAIRTSRGKNTWQMDERQDTVFSCADEWGSAKRGSDDSVEISVPYSWFGRILPADADSLPKPTD